jgi:hypothetical protein
MTRTMMMIVTMITTGMMTIKIEKIETVEREVVVGENVVREGVVRTMMMIVTMITTGMIMIKIETVEREVIVGENVVREGVVRTMMMIVMMITTGMIREMIAEENIVEQKAARVVG